MKDQNYGVPTAHLPTHVAIIPDGNRRWAREQGKSAIEGHTAGAAAFRQVAEYAAKRGVECLSIWGLSLDNFTKRSPQEIAGLLNLFRQEFKELAQTPFIHEQQIQVQVFGWWRERFPRPVRREIEATIKRTRDYEHKHLNFFLAYNGTHELLAAIQALVGQSTIEPKKVTGALLKQYLFTKDLPPVDLLIRTGGEPHLSAGFMMWDMADAQLYFTRQLWPAFTPAAFEEALVDYQQRQRRFGQ